MKIMQETYIIQYIVNNSHENVIFLFYVLLLGLRFSKLIQNDTCILM
jgi:hypothetical protein